MKKFLTMAVSAGLLLLIGTGGAVAHEGHGDTAQVIPVEAFVCKFKDGKGWKDLDAANTAFNEWMDEIGANDYFAAIMTPRYHPDYDSMDFGWVGGWRDGNSMGTGMDAWLNEGQEIAARYKAISTCSSGSSFVSRTLRPPADRGDDDSDNSFVLSFSDCSLKTKGEEGAWDAYMAAEEEWNAYADEHGIEGSRYLWWPNHGAEDKDYDFKHITVWDDHTMRGGAWAKLAEGHWYKTEELFAGKLDCDNGRLYDARIVRNVGEN